MSSAISSGTKRRSGAQAPSQEALQKADLACFFECPVCFDYALPPIYQCASGHLLCSECRPKISSCPSCRGPLGNIRNLAMEKVAQTVFFPCRHASNGCGTLLLHTEKLDHEENCEFRPYACPCPGATCKWNGSLEHVMQHLLTCHKSITTLHGEDIVFLATDINLPGAVDWVMMQSCFGHNFMLVLEKQDRGDRDGQQFYAVVQLIGSKKQSEKFAYRLELNGHRRRLAWEATPRSIHDGIASAIQSSDCLSFDSTIAQGFSENGNLGINVTISMFNEMCVTHCRTIFDPNVPGTPGPDLFRGFRGVPNANSNRFPPEQLIVKSKPNPTVDVPVAISLISYGTV